MATPRDTGMPKTWMLMRPNVAQHCAAAARKSDSLAFAELVVDQRHAAHPSPLLVRAVGLDLDSVPRPAASIITPMMLLALTRRPLRLTCGSRSRSSPASLVSLAEARACRPELIADGDVGLDHRCRASGPGSAAATPPPASRPGWRRRPRARPASSSGSVRVTQRAPQHRHVDAGDDARPARAVGQRAAPRCTGVAPKTSARIRVSALARPRPAAHAPLPRPSSSAVAGRHVERRSEPRSRDRCAAPPLAATRPAGRGQ